MNMAERVPSPTVERAIAAIRRTFKYENLDAGGRQAIDRLCDSMLKADRGVPWTYYQHFPGVVIPEHEYGVAGGILRHLTFAEFQRLEPDYAVPVIYDSAPHTFWIVTGEEDAASDELFERLLARGMLLNFALAAVTGLEIQSCMHSAQYLQRAAGRPAGREGIAAAAFLIDRQPTAGLRSNDVMNAGLVVDEWLKAGLLFTDAVLAPLRVLSYAATAAPDPWRSVAPAVIALEAYLLGEKLPNLSKTLQERAGAILGTSAPPHTDLVLKLAYKWRSSIVHGRPLPPEASDELYWALRKVIGAIVISAVRMIRREGLDPNNLPALRRKAFGR